MSGFWAAADVVNKTTLTVRLLQRTPLPACGHPLPTSRGEGGKRIPRRMSHIDPMNPCTIPSPSPPHTCGGEGRGEEAPFSIRVHGEKLHMKVSWSRFASGRSEHAERLR